jgi:outer membrane biosynthesis protein TonB
VHQISPADLRQLACIDVLPRLLNARELAESMERHYPAALRGQGTVGTVLVDVSIDEGGHVTGVTALPAPTLQAHGLRGARPDLAGLPVEAATPASTARFGDAARAALGAARFSPAQLDGKPVPFTLRMTVRFSDPDASGTA